MVEIGEDSNNYFREYATGRVSNLEHLARSSEIVHPAGAMLNCKLFCAVCNRMDLGC